MNVHPHAVGLLSLLVVSMPLPALAWGAEGHEAVCEIAYLELTPEAKQAVDSLIAKESDEDFKTFRQACTWADHPGSVQQQNRPNHYINVPRNWTSIWYEECHETQSCLFSAIRREVSKLEATDASSKAKLPALKFLGHWVGDIHQPLHISFADDREGNDLLLTKGIGCKRKLHDVWDNCIPEDLMKRLGAGKDRAKFGQKLHAQVTDAERAEWTKRMRLVDWANESFEIVRQPETQYCILDGKVCRYAPGQLLYERTEHMPFDGKRQLKLTPKYERDFGQIVQQRLKQAGVRLGAMLNGIFAPSE